MSQENNDLKPTNFDCSDEKEVLSFYPSVSKNGQIVTKSTIGERKTISYKELRKAYFAGK